MQDSKHIINSLPPHAAYLPLADFWRVTSDDILNLGIHRRILHQPLRDCISTLIAEWQERNFFPVSTTINPSNSRTGIKKQAAYLKSQFSVKTDITPLAFDMLRLAKAFQIGSKIADRVNIHFAIQEGKGYGVVAR
jgi:hypothetical protein